MLGVEHGVRIAFCLVLPLGLALIPPFKFDWYWDHFLPLLDSVCDECLVLDEFILVDVCNALTLNIHATVTVAADPLQSLDPRALVSEAAADDHADAMRVLLGPVVITPGAVIIIDKIDRVKISYSYIHTLEVSVWGVLRDSREVIVFCELVIKDTIGIN